MTVEKQTGSFRARNALGQSQILKVVVEFDMSGNVPEPGCTAIKTQDGTKVNRIGKGEYKVDDSMETLLWTDDDDAP